MKDWAASNPLFDFEVFENDFSQNKTRKVWGARAERWHSVDICDEQLGSVAEGREEGHFLARYTAVEHVGSEGRLRAEEQ